MDIKSSLLGLHYRQQTRNVYPHICLCSVIGQIAPVHVTSPKLQLVRYTTDGLTSLYPMELISYKCVV